MRRLGVILATAMVLIAGAVSAWAGGTPVEATLTPASGSAASGVAELTLNQGQGEICFDLSWTGTTQPVTSAHIHRVSDNGIAAGLFGPPGGGPVVNSGCVTAAADVVKAIRQDPSAYYVNLHTSTFPGGELSGVLQR